jgi:hypothetical protein
MSSRQSAVAGLLRWYPAEWRERYGEEFAALMEDALGGRPPALRFRLSVARAGLRERRHQAGLVGSSTPAADRVRVGFVLVLCAWTAFVVAGSVFAKLSENFAQAVPAMARPVSVDAFSAVQVVAAICGFLVLAGALVAGPAFVRFLRAGGWGSVRRHVLRAAGTTVAAAAALTGLTAAAHALTFAQRNGGDWLYSLAFIGTALLLWTALALWTAAAAATARRLALSRNILAAEAVLAAGATAGMVLITAATASWWAVIASSAPWFLQGTPPGSASSAFTPNLIGTMALMLAAGSVAAYGVTRAARSWREVRIAGTLDPGTAES